MLFRSVAFLSSKLEITPEKVTKAMEADNQYSILQEKVEKPVADEVLAFFNQYDLISLNVEEDTKRYYPQNELAASVIGFRTRQTTALPAPRPTSTTSSMPQVARTAGACR